MLESTQKLTKFAKNREKLISTLVTNLERIKQTMGGRNDDVMGFLKALELPIDSAHSVLDEFRVTATAGPALFEPIERLLEAVEIREDTDMAQRIKTIFKNSTQALGVFDLMPNALDGLKAAGNLYRPIPTCSEGTAQIPLPAQYFIDDKLVVLCKP